jgi:2'-5' RNA ligase
VQYGFRAADPSRSSARDILVKHILWASVPNLLALDVAILPPPDIGDWAKRLNAQLPAAGSQGLVLDETHLPHITLTQQFVRIEDVGDVLRTIAKTVNTSPPLDLRITGGARGGRSVWMGVERAPALVALHEHLMRALEPFERSGGTAKAFGGGDARPGDVAWVSGYRTKSSFSAFRPHITIGHAEHPPQIEPREFSATTIAACHLGRFCTCMRVLEEWRLS